MKGHGNLTNQALTLNPQGKRKPGRPKTTWSKELLGELEDEKISPFTDASTFAKSKKIGEPLCVAYALERRDNRRWWWLLLWSNFCTPLLERLGFKFIFCWKYLKFWKYCNYENAWMKMCPSKALFQYTIMGKIHYICQWTDKCKIPPIINFIFLNGCRIYDDIITE